MGADRDYGSAALAAGVLAGRNDFSEIKRDDCGFRVRDGIEGSAVGGGGESVRAMQSGGGGDRGCFADEGNELS